MTGVLLTSLTNLSFTSRRRGNSTRQRLHRSKRVVQDVLPFLASPVAPDRISLVGETPEGFRLIRHAASTGESGCALYTALL